jgi:transposase
MRFAGIDVASEKHVVAVVDERSELLRKATTFTEDAAGYKELLELLGAPDEVLVVMEATGVYGRNLLATLIANGYSVAVVNPLRTHRFAGVDLQRTKTDAIDALAIARFAAQKRPVVARLPDSATEELRELVHLRDRIVQDFGIRLRQIHRLIALGFPEFTRYVHSLDSTLATAILKIYPTAQAFVGVRPRVLSKLKYDGVHLVGLELATRLTEAAKVSVGRHHGHPYRIQMKFYCEDMDVLRRRIKELDKDIEKKLGEHEIGMLLTTIDGIGPNTAARLVSVLGNPADFRNERALASYIGLVPALRQSGKATSNRASLTRVGNAALRSALYMPTVTAVTHSPWLRAFYLRLVRAGKPPKVALLASMRKLVTAIYSVAKHRRPFVPRLPEAAA